MSNQAELNSALRRIAKAIAKKQVTITEVDQENLKVTQDNRSVTLKINQLYKAESNTDFR